jgi:tetratricopeptide (TPR) repeat protein
MFRSRLGPAHRLADLGAEHLQLALLDRLNLTASTGIATVLAQMGRQDKALEQLKRTIELNPRFGVALGTRADIYTSRHQYSMALDERRLAGTISRSPASRRWLATFHRPEPRWPAISTGGRPAIPFRASTSRRSIRH